MVTKSFVLMKVWMMTAVVAAAGVRLALSAAKQEVVTECYQPPQLCATVPPPRKPDMPCVAQSVKSKLQNPAFLSFC